MCIFFYSPSESSNKSNIIYLRYVSGTEIRRRIRVTSQLYVLTNVPLHQMGSFYRAPLSGLHS